MAKMTTMQRHMQSVSLGQKLKMLKRCEKQLNEDIRVVCAKKRLEKTFNILKMRAF